MRALVRCGEILAALVLGLWVIAEFFQNLTGIIVMIDDPGPTAKAINDGLHWLFSTPWYVPTILASTAILLLFWPRIKEIVEHFENRKVKRSKANANVAISEAAPNRGKTALNTGLVATANILYNSDDNSFSVLKYDGSIKSVAVEQLGSVVTPSSMRPFSIIFVFVPSSGPFDIIFNRQALFGAASFGFTPQITNNTDRSVSILFERNLAGLTPQTRTLEVQFYRKQ